MFVHGRRSYIIATFLACILHAAIAYTLWHYRDTFVKTALLPPSMQTILVNDKLQPLALQTQFIIEKPAPPQPVVEEKKQEIQATQSQPESKPEKKKPVAQKKITPTTPKKDVPVVQKQSQSDSPKKIEKPQPSELDALVTQLQTDNQPQKAPARPLTPEMRVTNRYVQRIQQQIENAWIQPPNVQYREMAGFRVLIRLTLNPSGKLISARVLTSSGNPQYDRSALNAVYRVGRFQVPSDADLFNRFFRQVNINYSL